jgi:hypothetical protein
VEREEEENERKVEEKQGQERLSTLPDPTWVDDQKKLLELMLEKKTLPEFKLSSQEGESKREREEDELRRYLRSIDLTEQPLAKIEKLASMRGEPSHSPSSFLPDFSLVVTSFHIFPSSPSPSSPSPRNPSLASHFRANSRDTSSSSRKDC